MNKVTSTYVFSYIHQCKKCFERGVKVKDLSKPLTKYYYNRQDDYIKFKIKAIKDFIESNHFTYKDLKLFVLYSYIFKDKLVWADFNTKEILKVKKLFSNSQYNKDKQFILEIDKKVNLKDIKKYFEINEDGKSLVYDLIINNYVSPLFYTKMMKQITNIETDKECDRHRRFRIIVEKLSLELEKN